MLHSSSGSGIWGDYAPAMQALWSKGIQSDSHPSIHTMFVPVIINAITNLKQFGPLVVMCVESSWPGSWFAMAVLDCSNNISKIIMPKDNRNHLAVTDDGILISIFYIILPVANYLIQIIMTYTIILYGNI